MANVYDEGDLARISAAFTVAGTATDPTTVTLKVRDPSGNTDTYTYALGLVTKSSTGNYYKDITLDEVGRWYYRWAGTGTVVSQEEGYLFVKGGAIT